MNTIEFAPNFILAAVNLEMNKASKSSNELTRLMSIGYLNSQTGLDVAKDIKTHLMKAYELLDKINTPETNSTKYVIAATMAKQDLIIKNIEFSIKN